jgi:hypothetical protein
LLINYLPALAYSQPLAAKVTFFSDIQLCLPEKVSISAIDLTFLSSFSYVSLHFQHVKEHLHNTYVTWIVAQRYGGFGRKTNDLHERRDGLHDWCEGW